MAKFYGSATKSGRVGGSVFAIRHGETIERQYQPMVNNPKTTKQVGVRAALKLLSQVSASLASIIAFRRDANVSPRNKFVAANYAAVGAPTLVNGEVSVSIDVDKIDLTGGVLALPNMVSPIVSGQNVSVGLLSAADARISRVLYALVGIKEGDRMTVLNMNVVEEAGENRTFTGSLTIPTGTTGRVAVFAYGVADLTETARVTYENYKIGSTPEEAILAAVRNLSINDVVLTVTDSLSFTLA